MTACPNEVITCGAWLLEARRRAADMTVAVQEAYDAIEDAYAACPAGVRRMQLGEAKALLLEAMQAEHKIAMAHDSLRKLLGKVNVDEPTDAQLIAATSGGTAILGGGGGGR